MVSRHEQFRKFLIPFVPYRGPIVSASELPSKRCREVRAGQSKPEPTTDPSGDRMITAMREVAARLNGIVQSAVTF
jgi:hypothetical protein